MKQMRHASREQQNNEIKRALLEEINQLKRSLLDLASHKTELGKALTKNYREMIERREELLRLLIAPSSRPRLSRSA